MDDFILIHHDKNYLKNALIKIKNKLNEYGLKLNNTKIGIVSIKNGFVFLGYHFKLKNNKIIIKLCRQTRYKINKNLKLKHRFYKKNIINFEGYFCSLNSYCKY